MKKSITIALLISIFFLSNTKAENIFNDVNNKNINKSAIEFLQNNKVIQGYSDNTFKPDNRINRAEFIKILVANKVKNPTGSNCFTDVKDEWYAPYICTAKKLKWIKGYSDNSFKPSDNINFVEASKIIANANKLNLDNDNEEWYSKYVNALSNKKAIPFTVQSFDKKITRGEVSEVIWRLSEKIENKTSQTYENLKKDFPSFSSCDALKEKFDDYQSRQIPMYRYQKDDRILLEAVPTSIATDSSENISTPMATKSESVESGASNDFSSTNIQVEGVDEADFIKNDGKYIYIVNNGSIKIVEAYPATDMKVVSTIKKIDGFSPSEIFINDNKLFVIGNAWYNSPIFMHEKSMIYPPIYRGNKTVVYTYDISDKTKPIEDRKVSYDANYLSSRMIGDYVYLTLNSRPNVWYFDDIKNGENLLPTIQKNDENEEKIVSCKDVRYFPGNSEPNYLIVSSIPLKDKNAEIKSEVFLGSGDNIYSSQKNMYIAKNEFNYNYYSDWNDKEEKHTNIYKFSLDNGDVDFISKGRVNGTILNQFSMDEYKNNFRIATTVGNQWNKYTPLSNNIYVLDKKMNTLSSLEGLAKNEKIYSTRFLGNRLYMVTFKSIDPLFVIDLKDPNNIKILGELKIPGYSNYLHPIDENYLMGFGQDTKENQHGGTVNAGFKMSIFDVRDIKNPKEKFVEKIGDQGTYSELLRDHKALLFDKEKGLLAFPIRIQEKLTPEYLACEKYRYSECPDLCQKRCIPSTCTEDEEGRAICTNDCEGLGSCIAPSYDRYTTTFSGALIYDVNTETGFKKRGEISAYENMKIGEYLPYTNEIKRIIYIGEYLYSIAPNKIKAATLKTVENVNSLNLSTTNYPTNYIDSYK